MFTGIVEELGTVKRIDRGSNSCQISILAKKVLEDVKIGDSIAINGVCLTVTSFEWDNFAADMMAETLKKTNLKDLGSGQRVNLERATRLGDRMGGHLVQGHVDAVGTIVEQQKVDIAQILRISAPEDLLHYLVAKGSVAIDGISLTVVEVLADSFKVSIIPHTAKMTTLGFKKSGDTVNLESDIIGRYVEKLLRRSEGKKETILTSEYLAQHGFI
ncbi:MAG: riboflavin synthase [Firmicutes bacterium HGW-Firmicutes-15]|nr:MAG: riboflavin synthase [Firmicutes bacterium HGW-Firmicutes-15]